MAFTSAIRAIADDTARFRTLYAPRDRVRNSADLSFSAVSTRRFFYHSPSAGRHPTPLTTGKLFARLEPLAKPFRPCAVSTLRRFDRNRSYRNFDRHSSGNARSE